MRWWRDALDWVRPGGVNITGLARLSAKPLRALASHRSHNQYNLLHRFHLEGTLPSTIHTQRSW